MRADEIFLGDVVAQLQRLKQRECAIGIGPGMLEVWCQVTSAIERIKHKDQTPATATPRVCAAGTMRGFVKPVVSLKTLYSDFVVREMCPFYRHGEPLQLDGVNVDSLSRGCSSTTSAPALQHDTDCEHTASTTDMVTQTSDTNGLSSCSPSTMNDLSACGTTLTAQHASTAEAEDGIDGSQKRARTESCCNNDGAHEATGIVLHRTSESCSSPLTQRIHDHLHSLLDESSLQRLIAGLSAGETRIYLCTPADKTARAALHQQLRACLQGSHVSTTAANGALYVCAASAAERREERRRSNPRRRRPFLHFTLYKENFDSHCLLRALARLLSVPTRQLFVSGTKDKRAVTLQRVAVQGLCATRLQTLVHRHHFGPQRRVRVCGFCEKEHGLRLGDALGNHFTIVLRLCTCAHAAAVGENAADAEERSNDNDDAEHTERAHEPTTALPAVCTNRITPLNHDSIVHTDGNHRDNNKTESEANASSAALDGNVEEACHDASTTYFSAPPTPNQLAMIRRGLSLVGAANYFGTQRFGTTSVLTSDVGVALLRGEWTRALHCVFDSRAEVVPTMRAAQLALRAGDYLTALQQTPPFCLQERDMLRHLVHHPNDVQGAFAALPRTLMMLYVHAVQSLVWNRVLARRLRYALSCATLSSSSSPPELTPSSLALLLRPQVGDLVLESVYQSRVGRVGAAGDGTGGIQTKTPRTDCTEDEHKTSGHDNTTNTDSITGSDCNHHEATRVGERGVGLAAVHRLGYNDDLDVFSLRDVVLPLPGPDAELCYPDVPGCRWEDYQAEMGALDTHDGDVCVKALLNASSPLVKVLHFHGAYRPMCVAPGRLALRCSSALHWRAVVQPTDWELLEEQQREQQQQHTMKDVDHCVAEGPAKTQPNSCRNDQAAPVSVMQVCFTLPPGSYATSVLREFVYPVMEEGVHSAKATSEMPGVTTEADDDSNDTEQQQDVE